ncbi:MAG TPA: hypothetical protein VNI02_18610 [Blastocatellia bacterium]|jgi:hypothetical protein|nr:hypothetical protein [Blastocatellia bacterium]
MPDTDIDLKINKLLENIHHEELEQSERRYRDETQSCLTFARTRTLALDSASASDAENVHIRSCPHCTVRLQSFREQLHPSLLKLLLFNLGRLDDDERRLVQNHMNEGCVHCRRLLATQWAEKATAALKTGRRTAGQLAGALSRAVCGMWSVPALSLNYESRKSVHVPFAAHIEQDNLSLMLEETDADELFVRVSTQDASLVNQYVHLEVSGGERPVEAEVKLAAVGDYYQGVHYFTDFSLLTESGAITVLAIPASDGESHA